MPALRYFIALVLLGSVSATAGAVTFLGGGPEAANEPPHSWPGPYSPFSPPIKATASTVPALGGGSAAANEPTRSWKGPYDPLSPPIKFAGWDGWNQPERRTTVSVAQNSKPFAIGDSTLDVISDSSKEVAATAKVVVGPDGAGTLHVTAEIQKDWHVYSVTQKPGGPTKTTIAVDEAGFKLTGKFVAQEKFTEGERLWGEDIPVEEHHDRVTWLAPVQFDKGADPEKTTISGKVVGQVCHGVCKDFSAPFTAKYEKGTATATALTINHAKVRATLGVAAAAPGDRISVRVTIEPNDGWHAYQLERLPVDENKFTNFASVVAFQPPEGFKAEIFTAGSPTVAGTDLAYYEGTATFTGSITVPKDAKVGETVIIPGVVGFQVCSKGSCDSPTAARFSFALPIQSQQAAGEIPATLSAAKYEDAAELAKQTAVPPLDMKGLLGLIGFSFLGGLILNLMPCVLPVIGLKVLSFVEQAHHDRRRVFFLNLAYTVGLLAVFMVLAVLSTTLNLAWGEQFTSTEFKLAMSALVFAMALSFLGVWEIPIPGFVGSGKAVELAQREGYAGAICKGALTTVLATPCSAPFLGPVFGATVMQPPYVTYIIFASIGLGMASPYLVIGANPKLVKFLPKPGAWMETFKQSLAFFLLATVVYLFSSLSKELVVPAFGLLVAIWAGCWLIGKTPPTAEPGRKAFGWGSGIALAACLAWLSFYLFAPVKHLLPWQPYSLAAVEQAKAEGKTVLVEFTANWCANCIVNMKTAIDTEPTLAVVEKNNVVTFLADWTDKSPEIKRAVNALGSDSIPLLAIYPAGKPNEPIILRDTIFQSDMIEALERAGPSRASAAPTKPADTTATVMTPAR